MIKLVRSIFKGACMLPLCMSLLLAGSPARAESAESISYVYEISVKNTAIGNLTEVRRSAGKSELEILRNTRIKIEGMLGNYELGSTDKYTLKNGRLQNVLHLSARGNKIYRIEGERKETGLWFQTGYVQNLAALEDEALADSAVAVAVSAIPYLGLALALLSDSDTRPEGDMLLADAQFDAVVFEIPWLLKQLAEKDAGPQHLRLLDTETLKVVSYKLEIAGADVYPLAVEGKDEVYLPYQQVVATTAKYQYRYWIGKDRYGPYIIRLEGEDSDGPYTVQLQDIQM